MHEGERARSRAPRPPALGRRALVASAIHARAPPRHASWAARSCRICGARRPPARRPPAACPRRRRRPRPPPARTLARVHLARLRPSRARGRPGRLLVRRLERGSKPSLSAAGSSSPRAAMPSSAQNAPPRSRRRAERRQSRAPAPRTARPAGRRTPRSALANSAFCARARLAAADARPPEASSSSSSSATASSPIVKEVRRRRRRRPCGESAHGRAWGQVERLAALGRRARRRHHSGGDPPPAAVHGRRRPSAPSQATRLGAGAQRCHRPWRALAAAERLAEAREQSDGQSLSPDALDHVTTAAWRWRGEA